MTKYKSIEDVSKYHGCTGCGACSYSDPNISIVDNTEYGLRPISSVKISEDAMDVCPGAGFDRNNLISTSSPASMDPMWGPVLEVYEGYATDDKIRIAGSSGGIITALSSFAIKTDFVTGVLHTVADDIDPSTTKSVISRTVAEVESATGSRYATSSPLSGLSGAMDETSILFVGKPCDAVAMHKVKAKYPAVDDKIKISLSFFCAGTPSSAGNKKYIKKKFGKFPDQLQFLTYRGDGWPGLWKATGIFGGMSRTDQATYAESWGELQGSRQWRCYICPDHSGEFSDISLGDAWYKVPDGINPGSSLIVVRSIKGKEFFDKAIAAGVVKVQRHDRDLIDKCQPYMIDSRGDLWGRLIAMRFSFIKTPSYKHYPMFRYWLSLDSSRKLKSIFGTFKRVIKKKLYQPET